MTDEEYAKVIEADRLEYERRWQRKHKARLSRYERNKRRGWQAFIERLKTQEAQP